jgi:hypothetical protein
MQKTFNVSRYSFVDQLFKVGSPDGRTGWVRAAGGGRFPMAFRAGPTTCLPFPCPGGTSATCRRQARCSSWSTGSVKRQATVPAALVRVPARAPGPASGHRLR